MGCYNYSNGLFEIQVKLLKNWVLITHLFFQCRLAVAAQMHVICRIAHGPASSYAAKMSFINFTQFNGTSE